MARERNRRQVAKGTYGDVPVTVQLQPEPPHTATVGILGGMGPHATVAFMDKIISLTPANKDWEHLHLLVDSNPHIPSRTRHLLYGEPSPVPGMIDACRKLAAYPVDLIAIPCNSACYFVDEIVPFVEIPILNIVEATANKLAAEHPKARRCAAIGGRITYEKTTYRKFLEMHGVEYVHHDDSVQEKIEGIIERIKLDPRDPEVKPACLAVIGTIMEQHHVDALILGCTEFGCVTTEQFDIPIIDSSTELARTVIEVAGIHDQAHLRT